MEREHPGENILSEDEIREQRRDDLLGLSLEAPLSLLDEENLESKLTEDELADLQKEVRHFSHAELDLHIKAYETILGEVGDEASALTLDKVRLAALYQEAEKRLQALEVNEGKETVEEVRENLWLLRKEGSPNPVTMVLRRDNQLFVTDPGVSWMSREKNKDLNELEDALGAKVSGILLTHSHPDHVGNIPEVADPETPIYLHRAGFWNLRSPGVLPRVENMLTKKGGGKEPFPNWQTKVFPAFVRAVYGPKMKGVKKITEEGGRYQEFPKEPMEFDGYSVEVIPTPGHAKGEVSFWIPEERVLIGGDLIPNTHVGRDGIPSLYLPEANVYDALDSLKKIQALRPRLFIPTHGDPIRSEEELQERIEQMIAFLETRIHEVETLHEESPEKSPEDLAQLVFAAPDFPPLRGFGALERKTIVLSILRDKKATTEKEVQ